MMYAALKASCSPSSLRLQAAKHRSAVAASASHGSVSGGGGGVASAFVLVAVLFVRGGRGGASDIVSRENLLVVQLRELMYSRENDVYGGRAKRAFPSALVPLAKILGPKLKSGVLRTI